jgi:hypothetical protein
MTVAVTRMSLVALLALLCTFTVGSAGTALADASNSGADSVKLVDKSLPSPDEFIAIDVSPVLVNQPQAVYPDSAKKANIEGSVWVKVLIDKLGGVEEAALAAVKQATWKPAMINNKPVAVWVSYEIKFVLKSKK